MEMLINLWVACTILGTLSAAAVPEQPLIQIYQIPELEGSRPDINPAPKSARLPDAEQALFKSEILPAAREHWKTHSAACDPGGPDGFPSDFRVNPSVARGSFTRPHATQEAVQYTYCQTGHNFALNGIVVFEADHTVAHVVYEGGWSSGIVALPDIDGNGKSKILMITGGTSMGAGWQVISILGMTEKGVRSFGHTETYSGECDSQADSPKGTETTYKLFVRKGATPAFYREALIKDCIGDRGKPAEWRRSGAMQQIALGDTARSPNTSWSMKVEYSRLK